MTLHEASVLRGLVVRTSDPLECEEDWATLRGQVRWFAALYQGDSRIPGTLKVFTYKPEHVAHVTSTRDAVASHVAFWALDESPTLVKLSQSVQLSYLRGSDYIYPDGHVGYRWIPPITVNITGTTSASTIITLGSFTAASNSTAIITFTYTTL